MNRLTRRVLLLGVLLLFPVQVRAQECGTIPAAGQSALTELAGKYRDLVVSTNDDERRVFAMHAAEQLAFTLPGAGWGTKRADSGRPPSKDSVSRVVDGTLCNWDIVNGDSRALQFGPGEPIPGQVFIAVTPRNYLGHTAPTDPIDEPGPAAGGATKELQRQQVALLVEILALEQAQIVAIQAASAAEIAKLDELKVSIIKAAKELTAILPLLLKGGGLGGLFK